MPEVAGSVPAHWVWMFAVVFLLTKKGYKYTIFIHYLELITKSLQVLIFDKINVSERIFIIDKSVK
jgi:hypothetical protein